MGNKRKSDIARTLRLDIVHGRLAPKSRLPTRDDLQLRFGASRQTVQNAVDILVRDGFLRAVRSEGTFVVDEPPHLCNYGFASDTPFTKSRFLSTMRQAAMKLTENADFRFSFYNYDLSDMHAEGYERLVKDVEAHRLAGLIFPFTPQGLLGKQILGRKDLPFVVNNNVEYLGVPQILLDHRDFLEKAVKHLESQGRKRIAQIGAWLHRHEMESDISYLLGRGLSHPTLTQNCIAFYPFGAYQAALLLMELPEDKRPDAMIIHDDHLVEAVTEGLAKSGLRIPQEFGVVAHCNFPDRPSSCVPVTRLGLDCMDLIHRDIRCLEDQRKGRKVPSRTDVPAVFESELAGLY